MDAYVAFLIFCVAASSLRIGGGQRIFNVKDFGATGNGKVDDSDAFLKAWESFCGGDPVPQQISFLVIPEGTFLLQPVKFEGPCKSSVVNVLHYGTLVAPYTIDAWKSIPNSWIQFSGVSNLRLLGRGKIDGQGSPWWNERDKGNDSINPPKALQFHNCNGLRLTGLTHINSPKGHIGINKCNFVRVTGLTIIAPGNSPNTDGIDISSSFQVHILNSFIGTGDDCVAINGDSSKIIISEVICGPGHGISVGSLGKGGAYETVLQVNVWNVTFNGALNAARIKTYQGGQGFARHITYKYITLIAVQKPIIIDQYYCNGKHNCPNGTSAVAVSDVTFSNFYGTSVDTEAITLDCDRIGCHSIHMDQINITSVEKGEQTNAYCQNAYGVSHSTMPAVPCLKG